MNFNDLYDTGHVRRFHTVPDYSGCVQQTVAEHAWGVALILIELGKRNAMPISANLLEAALLHDAEEVFTGDMPAPTKWRFPSLAKELKLAEHVIKSELNLIDKLLPSEELLLKWADSLELYAYAQRRARDGSAAYRTLVNNVYQFMMHELSPLAGCRELLSEMELGDWV